MTRKSASAVLNGPMSDESPWARLSGLPKWAFTSLEESTTATLSRSDVLRSLLYPIGFLGSLMTLLAFGKAPTWALIAAGVLLAGFLLLYAGVYTFCLIKRPDSLRSERYQLTKLALEQVMRGDSSTGLLASPAVMALPDAGTAELADAGPESPE